MPRAGDGEAGAETEDDASADVPDDAPAVGPSDESLADEHAAVTIADSAITTASAKTEVRRATGGQV
jgi:hypothetical protein